MDTRKLQDVNKPIITGKLLIISNRLKDISIVKD